jgi:chemotaxis signal transduction protein
MRRPGKPVAASPSVLVVGMGDRRLAVPAAQIVEVARLVAYTPLPCDDPTNLGVVLHRDTLIPLIDLASRLGARRAGPVGVPGLCLFVQTDVGEVGFPIDRVLGLESAYDDRSDRGVPVLDPTVLAGT